jgi:hypothetical protein
MTTMLSRIIGLVLGLSAAGYAVAECITQGCWDVYVDEIYPEALGGAWIQTSGDESLANCTVSGNTFLRLDNTMAGYKEMYATLLAAQLAEKKVSVRIAEGSNPCKIWYVTMNRNRW